jgi:hypothetical protein
MVTVFSYTQPMEHMTDEDIMVPPSTSVYAAKLEAIVLGPHL